MLLEYATCIRDQEGQVMFDTTGIVVQALNPVGKQRIDHGIRRHVAQKHLCGNSLVVYCEAHTHASDIHLYSGRIWTRCVQLAPVTSSIQVKVSGVDLDCLHCILPHQADDNSG